MRRIHVILFESKHHGWISYAIMGKEAKRLLKISPHIFYIFECDIPVFECDIPDSNIVMKLKKPLDKYYKTNVINIYKDEDKDEDEDEDEDDCMCIINDASGSGFQII